MNSSPKKLAEVHLPAQGPFVLTAWVEADGDLRIQYEKDGAKHFYPLIISPEEAARFLPVITEFARTQI